MIHSISEIDHDRILTCAEGESIVVGNATIQIIGIGDDEVLLLVDDSSPGSARPR
jgi:hypothetical protein